MSKLKKALFILLAIVILAFSVILFASADTTNSIGDVNADGQISAADARLALRASVGLEKLTNTQFKSADVNNDSKVTAADARTILRVSVGLDKFDIKGENTDNSSDNWHFEIDNNNIVKTNEFGGGYINNRVIIEFSNTNEEFIKDIVVSIDGKIIGFSETGTYQIEIQERTLEELKQLCKQLKGKEGIVSAHYDIIGTTSRRLNEITIPNDPWKDTFQGMSGTDWDEYNPNGLNWWLETIEAPSAWQNNNRFKNNIIGIVDDGFDYQHEDLGITVLNNSQNSFEDHGTHVAGIIGATANNNTGITGIVWNKDLYCYDAFPDKKISLENACKGIESLLLSGCKTINLSSEWYVEDNEINAYGVWAIEKIIKWKENPDIGDFIIVQSAGNHAYDSLKAGLFASITEEAMKLYCDENETKYSYDDIIQHIMTVGAVEKTSSGYQMTDFSNYGSNVSICAPGKDIFSTVVMGGLDGNYDNMNGTSMAAPIVTGVASLVWSVNPDFSAGEVKDIVCHSYNKTADPYHYLTDVRVYPIVNAKLAVEEAIRRTDNSGSISGLVKDVVTDKPIQSVKVTVKIDQTERYVKTDKNGNFELVLPEGEYELTVEGDGYATKRISAKCKKDVETVLLDTVYLTPTSYLMGTVIDKETNSPVENASVLLQKIDEAGLIVSEYTCSTDKDGKFEISVPVGNYTYTINKLDMTNELYEDATGTVTVNKADGNILDTVYLSPRNNSGDDNTGDSGDTEERPVIDSGNCGADGDNVTWTLYENGELVISGSGAIQSYSSEASIPWYYKRDYVTSVTISDGIKRISPVFYRHNKLKKITIGKSVCDINLYPIAECDKFEEFIVDKDNKYYSNDTNGVLFNKDYSRLIQYPIGKLDTKYIVPFGVKYIDTYSFCANTNIQEIVIPNSVISIGIGAFGGCISLKNITLPDSILTISNEAFFHCSSLTSIEIPDSVTSISPHTFYNCTSLTSIKLPNSIKKLDECAFAGCKNLESIKIPKNTTSIGEQAFWYCTSLKSIEIQNGIISIGNYAFDQCTSLVSIKIPDSVESIGDGVFRNCTSLSSIEISDKIKYIGEQAFWDCRSLKSIKIPEGITSIYDYTFSGCESLSLIEIPKSVKSIGNSAFRDCWNLTSINLPNGLASIGNYAFYRCASLTTIKIPNGVTSIGNHAFESCASLTTIILPNSVTTIDSSLFYSCDSLESVIIPKTITNIEEQAFFWCDNLTDVYYSGTQEEWEAITIGEYNECLTNATIHYNS